MLYKIELNTSFKNEMIDITNKVADAAEKAMIKDGECVVFVPHTTAGITINENSDPNVKTDIIKEMDKIIPTADNYTHWEGNSSAHIKSSIFGTSKTIIIHNGKLLLGRWQGIYFCEFDGPRRRTFFINVR